jgi:CubicO group peptidase (beta-lactamase class C family)
MKPLLILACSLLLACPPSLAATPSTSTAASRVVAGPPGALASDTPATTADGHAFVAPAGWTLRRDGAAVILSAPEPDSRIVLVDVTAADADAAVAHAWATQGAGMRWPLRLATDRPVRDGWEQARSYSYDPPADARRSVSARVLRHGSRWTVTLHDLSSAVAGTRDAQVSLVLGSLLPRGLVRETFAGRRAHLLDAARVQAMARFVEDARQQLDVPGVAIGIVQDGRVVMAQGFGVRELGKSATVDADTRFMIASNTKPLTTLMLARLVDAGRFTWDTPVTQVMPGFRLGDAATTAKLRMRHLVCACTGMPRQDMEWLLEGERMTPASMLATLATMQPTSGFGELYQYSNLVAGAAGYVGGHAWRPDLEVGAAYDAAMQALVFDPLGMTSTTFDFERAQRGNHAAPHALDVEGRTVPASMDLNYASIPSRPDGGAWSNVHDMLRYVQLELDEGVLPDGTRYIGQAPLLARRVVQVSRGDGLGYGMGLKTDDSTGVRLLHHGGIATGYISDVMWLPEHGVGAVILTNAEDGGISLRNVFRRRLLELLFDGHAEAVPNVPVFAGMVRDRAAAERRVRAVPAEPALAADLAAHYRSAVLGDIEVSHRGASTWFDFGGWRSEVASQREGEAVASFVTVSPGVAGFEFVARQEDGKRALVLRDEQHEYVFDALD